MLSPGKPTDNEWLRKMAQWRIVMATENRQTLPEKNYGNLGHCDYAEQSNHCLHLKYAHDDTLAWAEAQAKT